MINGRPSRRPSKVSFGKLSQRCLKQLDDCGEEGASLLFTLCWKSRCSRAAWQEEVAAFAKCISVSHTRIGSSRYVKVYSHVMLAPACLENKVTISVLQWHGADEPGLR